MTRSEANFAPSRLFWMEDPYSHRHFWHVLERKPRPDAPVGEHPRHAFLREPAWAKWKTHLAVADDETRSHSSQPTRRSWCLASCTCPICSAAPSACAAGYPQG